MTMRAALALVAILAAVTPVLAAPVPFYFNDFESGSIGELVKIDRYDDNPTVVTSDVDIPAAFPPPSGTHAVRCADDDNTFFGLNSARSIFYIDRTAINTSAEIQADIWLTNSAATNDFNALVAIEDVGSPTSPEITTERYYRLGLRNLPTDGIILQLFDGSGFTTLGTDPALGGSLTLPGWHTMRIVFDNADNIDCFVDGTPASFNPINNTIVPYVTGGMLGFDFTNQNPCFMDNLFMAADTTPATVPVELSTFTAD
jgi:hypothetical protein